ncbi:DNA polymerase III subunit beta [Streptomyces sp. CT34]|uniref:DNA polymerase III subunit beta n=1 Tax=Streptomyces sp. CT34 TaxID=1553907 RepID=UPI0005B9A051|nr:DNA polymerase III subunit beta [Streptomyces sp. CT34]
MKLIVNTQTLAQALRFVGRRLPSDAPMPVMYGIHLTARDTGEVVLTAHDMETAATATVQAEVREAGTAVLPGRMLRDLALALPGTGKVELTVDGGRCLLTFGGTQLEMAVLPVEEYPAPHTATKTTVRRVDGGEFAKAVAQVAFAAGQDETLPMLTCINLELAGRNLSLTATDRHRMALRQIPFADAHRKVSPVRHLVPATALKRVAREFSRCQTVTLAVTDKPGEPLTIASDDGRTVSMRQLRPGGYPTGKKLNSILPDPDSYVVRVDVDARVLRAAVTRMTLLMERHVPMTLTVNPDTRRLHLYGGNGDSTRLSDTLDARQVQGEGMRAAFNPELLLGGLKALKSRVLRLQMISPHKPLLVEAADGDGLRFVLMPIRTREGAAVPN